MKATTALKEMVRNSEKSAITISREIGRGSNYVSSLISSGSVPSVETFATIAKACGAQLQLVFADGVISIDSW